MKEHVIVMENDGHNSPLYYKFRDTEQAAKYIASLHGGQRTIDDEEITSELLEIGFEDEEFTRWETTDLQIDFDMTEDP